MESCAKLLRLLDRLSVLLAYLAGLAVLLLALLIAIDILARDLLGVSVQGTDEIGGYVLAMIGSLGLAYVLAERANTRMDLALPFLPRPVQRLLHVLAYGTLACLAVFMAYRAFAELGETVHFDSRASTPLQTPLWIPQGFWAVGIGVFALSAVLHALRATALLARGSERLEREYGATTPEEEVDALRQPGRPDDLSGKLG